MKYAIITIILFLALITNSFSADIFYSEYYISGNDAGNTEISGKLKMYYSSKLKSMYGSFFSQRPLQPIPDTIDDHIIVDFESKKKQIKVYNKWITTALSKDYNVIDEKQVNVQVSEKNNSITAIVNLGKQQKYWGSKNYKIILSYKKTPTEEEINKLKGYEKPTALDFLSFFLENEELARLVIEKMGNKKYMLPTNFTIVYGNDGGVELKYNGTLSRKKSMPYSGKYFNKR